MELVIGGYAQGKLDYVKNLYYGTELLIISEENFHQFMTVMEESDRPNQVGADASGVVSGNDSGTNGCRDKPLPVWNNLNECVKSMLQSGMAPDDVKSAVIRTVEAHGNMVVISDEIGSGIVPMDEAERFFREFTGRLQCLLAEKADVVVRVICGIGQRIK